MYYILWGLLALFLLSFGMLLCLHFGRKYAIWQEHREHIKKFEDMPMAEGAVMGLMALLVSFTFANASGKFDARRLLAVDDVNAIGTAYLRLDLLEPPLRAELQQDFRDYLDARLEIYSFLPDLDAATKAVGRAKALQQQIWVKAAQGCEKEPYLAACIILLPALNEMFDIANKRFAYSQIHPPGMVLGLLIVVALLSSLLTGYRMKNIKITHSLHIISYVIIIAFTIYVIIDIDYPRLGFIRMDAFDQSLIDLRASMK